MRSFNVFPNIADIVYRMITYVKKCELIELKDIYFLEKIPHINIAQQKVWDMWHLKHLKLFYFLSIIIYKLISKPSNHLSVELWQKVGKKS